MPACFANLDGDDHSNHDYEVGDDDDDDGIDDDDMIFECVCLLLALGCANLDGDDDEGDDDDKLLFNVSASYLPAVPTLSL